MKITVDAVDLTLYVRVDEFQPLSSDLGQPVQVATFRVRDPAKIIPKIPREGHDVRIYKDDNVTLLYRGRISNLSNVYDEPVGRAWDCSCQSYAVRALESQTGSADRSATTSSDREHVIYLWRNALTSIASSPNGSTLTDAIITANEPNWTGVGATSFGAGLDFSYTTLKSAMDRLADYFPNTYWRIGPDLILTYGLFRTLAPFALTQTPNLTTTFPYAGYQEEVYVGDHRNKMRRGALGAAEATAYDEVSIGRYGVVLEDPYKNDEAVPAADITRRAYAELKSRRVKRVARFSVRDEGLEAGQLIDVVNPRIGAGTLPAPFMDPFVPMYGRSSYGVLAGERGRLLIQKVNVKPLGNRKYEWDIEAGDNVRDFATVIANLAGSA